MAGKPPSFKRAAFYGGSFDPVHAGHLAVADAILRLFRLDAFHFLPAFHAPHKPDRKPTSAYHRYAMLCLSTNEKPDILVSRIEFDLPERPYTVETLSRLREIYPETEMFFVMGADSWRDITTWRDWEKVLTMINHIVVTRPGYPITFDHVTETIRSRIIDARGRREFPSADSPGIYMTDAVSLDVSASEIRSRIRENANDKYRHLPEEVAKYIEKYTIYR